MNRVVLLGTKGGPAIRAGGAMPTSSLLEMDGRRAVMDAPLRVNALRVPHPPIKDAFALRFNGTKSVTFSGDTTYFRPLAGFAQGSDLLVHEALLPAGVETVIARTGLGDKLRNHLYASHTKVQDVARIAAAAGGGGWF